MHQAGSDSLLTCATFFKMNALYFEKMIDNEKFTGQLYGLGGHNSATGAASYQVPTNTTIVVDTNISRAER
jgi:hypothetical protein